MRKLTLPLMFLSISYVYGASAAPADIQPGQYITEDGWGILDIKAGKGQVFEFGINTVGANGHTCELEGEITGNRAHLDGYEKGRQCTVSFQPSEEGIHVVPENQDTCRDFCGMRAGFEGLYLKVSTECTNSARDNTERAFKRLYDKKEYIKARLVLEALLKKCEKAMNWIELGSNRNDLAITQYHLGDYAGCLQTLGPYAADTAKQEDEVLKNYAPSDADSYSGILEPARTNIGLCRSGLRKRKD